MSGTSNGETYVAHNGGYLAFWMICRYTTPNGTREALQMQVNVSADNSDLAIMASLLTGMKRRVVLDGYTGYYRGGRVQVKCLRVRLPDEGFEWHHGSQKAILAP